MAYSSLDRPHILFLYSDTGGGHRSATEAIIEALQLEYNDAISTEMVDVFLEYAPRPFNYIPAFYPKIVRLPRAWGLGYHLSNGNRRARMIDTGTWPYVRNAMRRLIAQHPSDMIVSVHPITNAPALRALGKDRPKYVTVVTDLVTTHALWYHTKTDLCLVPTEEAYHRARYFGLKPDQIKIVGLPVADRFCQPADGQNELRSQFGWPQDRPLILLVGGGEGMGPLEATARAIASTCSSASLVVVAGRNQDLQARLNTIHWPIPTFIYGFVRQMPDFMRAADVLVTKAGPGTISEALIAGLPMVLYSRLPGQEDGNVSYVISKGAGIWAPHPAQVATAVNNWLSHPDDLNKAASACQKLACPKASRQIAHILAQELGIRSKVSANNERK